MQIDEFSGLKGYLLDIIPISLKKEIIKDLFFIEVNSADNYSFMNELVLRAEKVNKNG